MASTALTISGVMQVPSNFVSASESVSNEVTLPPTWNRSIDWRGWI
ncbi:MAG TPA: hypothetical protein VHX38_27695 [Pseudonocardiaceae bacterium]|nr:hypothetical protein [Pseudonocardiaceae bacterium]